MSVDSLLAMIPVIGFPSAAENPGLYQALVSDAMLAQTILDGRANTDHLIESSRITVLPRTAIPNSSYR